MHPSAFAESNYLPLAFDNEVLSDGSCQRPRGNRGHCHRHPTARAAVGRTPGGGGKGIGYGNAWARRLENRRGSQGACLWIRCIEAEAAHRCLQPKGIHGHGCPLLPQPPHPTFHLPPSWPCHHPMEGLGCHWSYPWQMSPTHRAPHNLPTGAPLPVPPQPPAPSPAGAGDEFVQGSHTQGSGCPDAPRGSNSGLVSPCSHMRVPITASSSLRTPRNR